MTVPSRSGMDLNGSHGYVFSRFPSRSAKIQTNPRPLVLASEELGCNLKCVILSDTRVPNSSESYGVLHVLHAGGGPFRPAMNVTPLIDILLPRGRTGAGIGQDMP
jgi:hypothetical protein